MNSCGPTLGPFPFLPLYPEKASAEFLQLKSL